MSIEHLNDHKFGLPNPDFCETPTKGIRKKAILLVGIVGLLTAASTVFYHFYWVLKPHIKQIMATASQTLATVDAHKQRSPTLPLGKTETSHAHRDGAGNKQVSDDELFESIQKSKKEEDIYAVQKKLEIQKTPQPFVKPGTYQTLREPQGIYHLVVVSHLSKKSAMQSVQRLIRKQLGVYLILPRVGEKYYRVTIGHSRTQYEAEQKLKDLQAIYKNIFILKY